MALQLLAANNAQSVLAAGISASATSLTLNTGTGALFPSPVSGTSFFKLTLIDAATGSLTEIVHVTARAGDVFTIQRGQEGTVPRAWSANDIAANMMTAGTLSYILGNFQPLDPTLTALAALVGVANKLPYFNGDDTAALTDLTQVGRDIIGKSTIADILTYLGLSDLVLAGVGNGSLGTTGYAEIPLVISGEKKSCCSAGEWAQPAVMVLSRSPSPKRSRQQCCVSWWQTQHRIHHLGLPVPAQHYRQSPFIPPAQRAQPAAAALRITIWL